MKLKSIITMKPLAIIAIVTQHSLMVLRRYFYKCIFSKIGKGCRLGKNISFVAPQNIVIGNNVRIGNNVTLLGHAGLTIGNNVYIAHNVSILTADHDYSCREGSIITAGNIEKPVSIGSNVWIGANSTILKGIKIADGTIVGANSVVTKNFPPDLIIAGVPARKIKNRYATT